MPTQDSKYAIRKSQSVGGITNNSPVNNNVKAKETPSLKTKYNIITEDEPDEVATPVATPMNGRKKPKLPNLFKWFSKDSSTQNHATVRNFDVA